MGSLLHVYIGTYTTGTSSEGIYHGLFDTETGNLELVGVASRAENPSYLAFHPHLPVIYAVSELGSEGDQYLGSVTAYAIDEGTGRLTSMNSRSTHGSYPCHVSVDQAARILMVANYGSGSAATIRLAEDGPLIDVTGVTQHEGRGHDPGRQSGPHVHAVFAEPMNRWAYVTDLGLDRVFIYPFDHGSCSFDTSAGTWTSLRPGSGPRHLAFHPTKPLLYVLNELNSTVTTMQIDSTGSLTDLATVSTLPATFAGTNTAADIHVHPTGRLLLASNRGHDSVAVFQISSETGVPDLLAHFSSGGKKPRSFTFDPAGRFVLVANQDTDRIVVFGIHLDTGELVETGCTVSVPAPVCIKIVGV